MSNVLSNEQVMDDLKLKFGGDTHQIDANTLINNLLHFTKIVQEVNKDLNTNRKIEVKINALNEGSFLVHIILQSNLLGQIGDFFTKENLEIAGGIVTVVGGIYGAAKFLKGKKPDVISSKSELSGKAWRITGNLPGSLVNKGLPRGACNTRPRPTDTGTA